MRCSGDGDETGVGTLQRGSFRRSSRQTRLSGESRIACSTHAIGLAAPISLSEPRLDYLDGPGFHEIGKTFEMALNEMLRTKRLPPGSKSISQRTRTEAQGREKTPSPLRQRGSAAADWAMSVLGLLLTMGTYCDRGDGRASRCLDKSWLWPLKRLVGVRVLWHQVRKHYYG